MQRGRASAIEITKYTAEYAPYVDVESEKDSIKTEYITEIRGVKYKGKLDDVFYLRTIDEICANYVCDDGTSFDVDLSKNRVVAVYFKYKKDKNMESISDRKKEIIAKGYVEEFINVEDYKMEVDKSDSSTWYIFTRYVGEFMTCEEVRVLVRDTGDISTFWAMEIGEFENVSLEGADGGKSEEALAEKIKELYGENVEYKINENFLFKTRENDIAMLYCINLTKQDGICERDFFIVLWE